MNDFVDANRMYPVAISAKDMRQIVDHLTNGRIGATHKTKALRRGGWSVGKVKGERAYWRGDNKPDYVDPDIRAGLIGF